MSSNSIDNIIFFNSQDINIVQIRNINLKLLVFEKCNIASVKILDTKVESITLCKLNIQTILMNTLSISKGRFDDINIQKVENNTTILLDDINKFSYQNVNIEQASREYFRFFKKYFSDKDDFINYNEMYEKEMNSYFKELQNMIKEKKNLWINLQNIIIVGFAKSTSNFGKSSILPFLLLLFCSFLNVYFTNEYKLSPLNKHNKFTQVV